MATGDDKTVVGHGVPVTIIAFKRNVYANNADRNVNHLVTFPDNDPVPPLSTLHQDPFELVTKEHSQKEPRIKPPL